jgi:hypothetical protein
LDWIGLARWMDGRTGLDETTPATGELVGRLDPLASWKWEWKGNFGGVLLPT